MSSYHFVNFDASFLALGTGFLICLIVPSSREARERGREVGSTDFNLGKERMGRLALFTVVFRSRGGVGSWCLLCCLPW